MMRWMVAVTIVAAATVSACTGQVTDSAESTTASGRLTASEPSSPPRLDCKRPSKGQVKGDPVVPSAAIAARLCGGLVDNAGFNRAWPADTLRGTMVARLVDRLNRLQPYEQPSVCEAILSPGFDLVLAYPDGSRVWVDGDTSGNCDNVAVRGGQRWTGADQVLRATVDLIESRRRVVGPTAVGTYADCPRNWNDVAYTAGADPVEPHHPVTVTACRYRLDRPEPGTITQSADGRLTAQVRVSNPRPLLGEVVNGSRLDPCGGVAYDLARTQEVLLVQEGYGDSQVVSTTPCWANQLSGQRRYPSATLTRRVTALLS